MRRITKKQREYIQILSSYPSTREKDERNIQTFLEFKGKASLNEISIGEASELIQILLSYQAEYVFPCGLKSNLDKKDVNCYKVMGSFEGCMHSCPDEKVGGDVDNCPYWIQKNNSAHKNT